jgi:hypothetical protein
MWVPIQSRVNECPPDGGGFAANRQQPHLHLKEGKGMKLKKLLLVLVVAGAISFSAWIPAANALCGSCCYIYEMNACCAESQPRNKCIAFGQNYCIEIEDGCIY